MPKFSKTKIPNDKPWKTDKSSKSGQSSGQKRSAERKRQKRAEKQQHIKQAAADAGVTVSQYLAQSAQKKAQTADKAVYVSSESAGW